MESKMTSIEWLIEKHFGSIAGCTPDFRNKIEQAKEMHKQEIIDAYGVKVKHSIEQGTTVYTRTFGEQYYNETYNK